MSTSQKVVVVTGASQGIGADVVKAFRKLDYRVVATARSIKPSDDPNILAVAGDIGNPETAQRVISEGVAKFGRIDTLVNNAGIYIGKPFTENTAEDYAAVMNVNMAGFFYITQLAIAEMEKHSSGHVVSVTASVGDNAISGMYSVLAALTKGGAERRDEVAGDRVREERYSRECCRARRHQDADARAGNPRNAG